MVKAKARSAVSFFLALLMIFLFICSPVHIKVHSTDGYTKSYYFADGNGSFRILRCSSQLYKLYSVSSRGETTVSASESIPPQLVSASAGKMIIVYSSRANTNVIAYDLNSSRKTVYLLPGTKGDPAAVCADQNDCIYFTDSSSSDVIIKYDTRGRELCRYHSDSRVDKLISAAGSGKAYALTDQGILDLDNNVIYTGNLPQGELTFNGNYFSDSCGSVYQLDDQNGFCCLFRSSYPDICFDGENYYAASGSRIIRLSVNGDIISEFDTGTVIDHIIASGSNVAYVCGDELYLLDKGSMRSRSGNNDPSASCVRQSDHNINSRSFTILGEMIISDKPGTTFAGFKNGISHGTYSVSAVDHNGSNVSSGILGTGARLIFSEGNDSRSFTIVVKGDVTGEGNSNSRDCKLIADYILDISRPGAAEKTAADINNDGNITLYDFYSLYRQS